MPRYRDRSVPATTVIAGPLAASLMAVQFVDGYLPSIDDPDLISIHQGTERAMALNEQGYLRLMSVTGHNSDALIRIVEKVAASGNAIEIENAARTKRIFGLDQHTGAVKLYDQRTASLFAVGPSDTRHADLPPGVTFMAGSQFAGLPDPSIYGVRIVTIDPNLCTLNRSMPAQELWAAKLYCNADMTLTTLSARVRTATSVVGVAGHTGYAIYSDGATMNLLGSTPDDTALFTSTGQKPKNLTTPVALVAGNCYWFAMLANYSSGTLEMATTPTNNTPGVTNSWPAGNTTALLAGQTSFPSTITRSAMVGNGVRPVIAGY